MPNNIDFNNVEIRHSDEMNDIISATPSWLITSGISLFSTIIILIVVLSAFIRYPEIVTTQLKVDSPNAPKPIVAKVSGKLVKLLAYEGQEVTAEQPLAYVESTANHEKVLLLLQRIKQMQKQMTSNQSFEDLLLTTDQSLQYGELQSAYESFVQSYLVYKSSIDNGFLIQKKKYLNQDLDFIKKQEEKLKAEISVQQNDLTLAQDEYEMHKKLWTQKVESPAEFRQQESKYLAKKSPLFQTESAILTGKNNYSNKESEIMELNNSILEEKSKFQQSLNSLISSVEDWKNKYVLTASESGRLTFTGIVQQNQIVSPNEEIFYINPGDEKFFGEMSISQYNMGKIKIGQNVLIKLKSYPFEEYGILTGKINYISDVPYKDSVFISRVAFNLINSSDKKKVIHLKQGMMAGAEIITQDATILQRLSRSLIKVNN